MFADVNRLFDMLLPYLFGGSVGWLAYSHGLLGWLWSRLQALRGGASVPVAPPQPLDVDELGQQLLDWFDAHGGDVREEVRDLLRRAVDLKIPLKPSADPKPQSPA